MTDTTYNNWRNTILSSLGSYRGAIVDFAGSEPLGSLFLFDSVTSTMDEVTSPSRSHRATACYQLKSSRTVAIWGADPIVVVSRSQVGARGQHGRKWVSEQGKGIWLTLRFPEFKSGTRVSSEYALAVGVAVCELLESLGARVAIKWPNDIWGYCLEQGRWGKLAGMLLESGCDASGIRSVSLGIGVNLTHSSFVQEQGGVSLDVVRGESMDVSQMLPRVLDALLKATESYLEEGFDRAFQNWNTYDLMLEREVIVKSGDQQVAGRAIGVNSSGALMIMTDKGQVSILSGTVLEIAGVMSVFGN